MPISSTPTPPRIDCAERAPAEPLPPLPAPPTMDAMAIWMAKSIGIHEREIDRRQGTADCLDALRKQGLIR